MHKEANGGRDEAGKREGLKEMERSSGNTMGSWLTPTEHKRLPQLWRRQNRNTQTITKCTKKLKRALLVNVTWQQLSTQNEDQQTISGDLHHSKTAQLNGPVLNYRVSQCCQLHLLILHILEKMADILKWRTLWWHTDACFPTGCQIMRPTQVTSATFTAGKHIFWT